ncbi:nicotinamide riboside transporter PnuC [Pinibacter soli]|uniref:Nicotinamide riboside transporter PnuC n=1 Tax=Pinibacter soli TaxID=3044211 RepID=A0ABT6R8C9_9BACT|nr:nicotinamide riboside transporter PnuC [Pinibacter soli]MDI3318817.1 nicotinamide riboside transporter PnuC [Pinibacter soli]
MNFTETCSNFIEGIKATTPLEFVAVVFGIISVLYSRKENILVYPTGIISTVLYIYLCFIGKLYAEASVNFYYTVMSIIGWIMWARKKEGETVLHITKSSTKEWTHCLLFFVGCWVILFLVLRHFTDSIVPLADGFAAASAYTGMWLMAKKKLENWIWWIVTNVASIPLYYIKGYSFTSFQFLVLLVLAIAGLITWSKKIQHEGH